MTLRTLTLAACLSLTVSPASADYIVNGNFEQGNTGFTTQYTYSPGELGPARTYDVVSNPGIDRPRDINPPNFGDHTTGHGLMFAGNGAEVPNVIVWSETLSIPANTGFDYSMWITN